MIAIGSDHGGFKLKEEIKKYLDEKEIEYKDFGCESDERTDYPIYAFKLGEAVANKEVDYGVAICGSGIGISIACNKVKGIRCAKVSNKEEAMYTRNDNNSNIVAFGEKTTLEEAIDIVKTFVETQASIEEKHQRRVNEIIEYEENN